MGLFVRLMLMLAVLGAPVGAWAQAKATPRIEAELVAMSRWAPPGSTVVVAVRQVIEPGWHTYWRNPGDSGGATTLTWALPAGVEAGAIVWPLPERQRLQGLVNYGYEGVVYLPVPVAVPADARGVLPLRVRALFLVCSDEMCVPDELELALDLPVREGAAPLDAEHGAAIQRAVERAPRPAGIAARLTLADGALSLTATGGPLTGIDPGPSYFFPATGGVIDHAAPQSGSYGPRGLTLALTPGGATAASGLPGPIEGVLATSKGAFEITAQPGPPLPGATGTGDVAPADDAVAATGGTPAVGFVQAALFALLGGLILNLMPCVFPILAMKAAALTRAAHDRREARIEAVGFLVGVLTTFLILGGALLALRATGQAAGWGFQLQSPPVTAGLALLMLAVALNLSGVFHVGGVQGAGSGWAARAPRGLSSFLTGALAVVVAAPCTAPFMALALGAALVMPWPMALLVFLMLGLGLALPFVAVALIPGVLARLPRPGPWMERLRGLLAFPMYATALWLAWVFSRQTGPDGLGLLFVAGAALALGLWVAGVGQADRAQGRRGVLALAGAVLALLLAAGAAVTAARSPVRTEIPAADAALPSQPWSEAAVQAALAEGRPVLVNFTADWCVTCKINERTALGSPRTAEAMRAANAVYLVGDWTRRDDAIAAELQRHGRSGVPLYLLHAPGRAEPRVLPQLLTEGVVVDALQGVRPPNP